MKNFKLKSDEIKDLAQGYGGCIASDMITVEGKPIMYMYRENPQNGKDSGWRFLSGLEDDEYMKKMENHSVYDVNTIANYDPTIVLFLDAPIGSEFEKEDVHSQFKLIDPS
jgi:hypothetical protein